MEAWKKHSSTTGGYFQCNRYETVNKIIAKEKDLVTAAEQRHLRMVELNKVNLCLFSIIYFLIEVIFSLFIIIHVLKIMKILINLKNLYQKLQKKNVKLYLLNLLIQFQ